MNWAYKVLVTDEPQKDLDKLGREGWELVAAEPETDDRHARLYLKRPADHSRSPISTTR